MYTGSIPPASSTSQVVTLPFIEELYDPNFLDILLPAAKDIPSAMEVGGGNRNPLMEALRSTTNQSFTTNSAPAYSSTGSATLDAFLGLNGLGSEINRYLEDAWNADAGLTLRIIWNLRSIHAGKSDKEGFYAVFGWLYDHHPRTAIQNLHMLVDPVCIHSRTGDGAPHGYWKDLLNIVALATLDQLSNMDQPPTYLHCPRDPYQHKKNRRGNKARLTPEDRSKRIAEVEERARANKEHAKNDRAVHRAESYERLCNKLANPKFRALYIAVARLFAERLEKDIGILKQIEDHRGNVPVELYKQISLAGKWAPTPNRSHDRHTNLATAISLLLHRAQATAPQSLPVQTDAPYPVLECHILRSVYQRWVLTPLRKALMVPEPLMSANRWKEIRYDRVGSGCMKNNVAHFYSHDPEGFEKYFTDVELGQKTISDATHLPHELVYQATCSDISLPCIPYSHNGPRFTIANLRFTIAQRVAEVKSRALETQWNTTIKRLRESGSIENAMAICDVSGSMGVLGSVQIMHVYPIYPAIALSLVLAQLAKPPFNNAFITFSSRPEFRPLDFSKGLRETIFSASKARWGVNTDLNAVFLNLILPLAVRNKVPQEDMIKRLFIFSDMQFDTGVGCSATPGDWQTNHDAIEKAYHAAGYEMPEIVYWDLANGCGGTTPVTSDRKGVALMNGFSSMMIKAFMGNEVDSEDEAEWDTVEQSEGEAVIKERVCMDPVSMMKEVLFDKSYDGLVVVD